MENEDGVSIENEIEIKLEAIKFFKNLYSNNDEVGWGVEGLNWCPISSERAAWVERPFEEVEVCNAAFDCGKDKFPGEDGFTLFFFQSCWDIVKGDLMKVIEDLYNSGIINVVTNEILICQIPKKKDSAKVRDFRPISLVTSLYKVVSKVLATRLREVLEETISATHGAFVKNRQILDAVLVANEVVLKAMKRDKVGLVFKIDFDHAYDHVEWKVVDEVMDRKGFGGRWRSWIMGYLQYVNFFVMINGRPMGKFLATRGVRQGDPSSPFLFTLVIDVLSRLMEKAQEFNLIHGLSTGRDNVEVSPLQFADDTIFLIGDKKEYWFNLLGLLDFFCLISGLKINKSKCSLWGLGAVLLTSIA